MYRSESASINTGDKTKEEYTKHYLIGMRNAWLSSETCTAMNNDCIWCNKWESPWYYHNNGDKLLPLSSRTRNYRQEVPESEDTA